MKVVKAGLDHLLGQFMIAGHWDRIVLLFDSDSDSDGNGDGEMKAFESPNYFSDTAVGLKKIVPERKPGFFVQALNNENPYIESQSSRF